MWDSNDYLRYEETMIKPNVNKCIPQAPKTIQKNVFLVDVKTDGED